MSCTWQDLRACSIAQAQGVTEAEHRSAISRGYYACFHRAIPWAEGRGYRFDSNSGTSHSDVWSKFRGAGISAQAVYNKQRVAKKWRERADYHLTTTISPQDTRDALSIFDELHDSLAAVRA
ncbi:hypothetical protein BH11ARM2_BH11ARM2_39760 [soil metagenome]